MSELRVVLGNLELDGFVVAQIVEQQVPPSVLGEFVENIESAWDGDEAADLAEKLTDTEARLAHTQQELEELKVQMARLYEAIGKAKEELLSL